MALGIITATVTIARMVFKRHFSASRRYSPDDWVVLSALAVGLPCAIVNRQGLVHHGLGKDAWTMSTEEISTFAMYFYILEALYLTAISLVKMTLLVFYLMIFPSVSTGTWTRRLLWGSMIFNILLAAVCILLAIFQCNPVSYYWKQFLDEDMNGTCIASAPVAWVNASLNVALDVWMILIPLKEVYNLRMHWKKKTGVIVMFLMGTFVTVVSILRLLSLSQFDASINITWDYYGVALWSTIEINVGIICTSLPTLRLILVRISPRAFGSQGSGSKSRHNSTADSILAARRQRRLSSVETYVGDDEELGPYARPKLFNVGSQITN
ncbi:hypothetical protein QQS21_012559 [Conoideocrella luteorostrata]|uniref:Rhodopsin domain-containing protein n=1 Tax=Conoideocrella luteorostrata TaxID=1105319 RepID=A0AAJ0CDT2_9HYPO|nr:hypothetical protein QQS21_012559 [Conoideocrella luteorostrata]